MKRKWSPYTSAKELAWSAFFILFILWLGEVDKQLDRHRDLSSLSITLCWCVQKIWIYLHTFVATVTEASVSIKEAVYVQQIIMYFDYKVNEGVICQLCILLNVLNSEGVGVLSSFTEQNHCKSDAFCIMTLLFCQIISEEHTTNMVFGSGFCHVGFFIE